MARHLHADREPRIVAESKCLGPCDPAERIHVTIMLRRQEEGQLDTLVHQLATGDAQAKPLSRAAFAQRFSAHPDDIRKAEDFARRHQLTVDRVDPVESVVVLSGTIQQFEAAFGVKLERFEHRSIGQFRGRSGPIALPDDLATPSRPCWASTTGRRRGRTFAPSAVRPARRARGGRHIHAGPARVAVRVSARRRRRAMHRASSNWAAVIARPTSSSISAGSGHDAADAVDGERRARRNAPSGDPNGPDGEVDARHRDRRRDRAGREDRGVFRAEQRCGLHRGRQRGRQRHDQQAVGDLDQLGRPGIGWTSSRQAFDSVLQSAAALGITVCAASGDSGSGDGVRTAPITSTSPHRARMCSAAAARSSMRCPGRAFAAK